MKGTDHFKRTIYMYLEQRAEEDALFAKKYRNPAKNMDECVTHILNYVQKSGCNGFTDGEIFGQAIHYYEENEVLSLKVCKLFFSFILVISIFLYFLPTFELVYFSFVSPFSFLHCYGSQEKDDRLC